MNAITIWILIMVLLRLEERIWNVATWTSVSVAILFLAILSNARASIHGGFRIITTSCPHLVPWATTLTADIVFGPFSPVTIYFKLTAIIVFALIHLDEIIYRKYWKVLVQKITYATCNLSNADQSHVLLGKFRHVLQSLIDIRK